MFVLMCGGEELRPTRSRHGAERKEVEWSGETRWERRERRNGVTEEGRNVCGGVWRGDVWRAR